GLGFALIVGARGRLGDRDRVGTGKGILQPALQRIVELFLAAGVLLAAAFAVRLVLGVVIAGRGSLELVHLRRPMPASRIAPWSRAFVPWITPCMPSRFPGHKARRIAPRFVLSRVR